MKVHTNTGTSTRIRSRRQKYVVANINQAIDELMKIEGTLATAIVDVQKGTSLGSRGEPALNVEATRENSEVVKAQLKVVSDLGLGNCLQEILITLDDQYHLIRLLSQNKGFFVYLVLDKSNCNLALARYGLTAIESDLRI